MKHTRRYYLIQMFYSVSGGRSALDIQRLHIKTFDEAEAFIKVYGFDLNLIPDVENCGTITVELLFFKKSWDTLYKIYQKYFMIKHFKGPLRLLLLWSLESQASSQQKWSCALLRVIHVLFILKMIYFHPCSWNSTADSRNHFKSLSFMMLKRIYLKGNLRDEWNSTF